MSLTSPPSPTSAPPACPKCSQARRESALDCPRCGLVFANWKPEAGGNLVAPLDAGAEALWSELGAAWTDDTRHDAFLKYCSAAGMLAAAGRRYRTRLDQRGDDQTAARMQERILQLATVSFTVQRTVTRPEPLTRKTWFWLLVAGCAAAGIVAAFLIA